LNSSFSDIDLVEKCIKSIRSAQEELYKRYASKMLGVCMRYARDKAEAEDVLQESFIKVFENLHNYRNEGSLEGWVRRIIVHTAINSYKKNLKIISKDSDETSNLNININPDAVSAMTEKELLKIINELPEPYKIVFNLFVIEGYSHKEISEITEIPENTSKSHLARARKMLQEKLSKIKISVE